MGFPNYRVGDDGSLWSKHHNGWSRKIRPKDGEWKQLALNNKDVVGHLIVTLHHQKKIKTSGVHRLVLLAFVGPPPEGMECCHEDGDPANNCLSNLRWDTHLNNEKDKARHGRNVGNRGNIKGEDNGSSKLTDAAVLDIRQRYALGGARQVELAEEYGVAQTKISSALRGETWKHVGGPIAERGKGGRRKRETTCESA